MFDAHLCHPSFCLILASLLVSIWTIQSDRSRFHRSWERSVRARQRKSVMNIEFRVENLANVSHRPCGSQKCLFILRRNRNFGFVANHEEATFKIMKAGWKLAQKIDDMGMEHVFEAPPKLIRDPPQNLRIFLGTNMTSWSSPNPKSRQVYFRHHIQDIPVQLVRVVSDGALLAFNPNKIEIAMNDTTLLLKDVLATPVDVRQFAAQFETDVKKLWRLLEQHRCLLNDFQIFLTRDGKIIHFDLDRCFECNNQGCTTLAVARRQAKKMRAPIEMWSGFVEDQLLGSLQS